MFMKPYQKALLTSLIIAAMPLMAASQTTINVTTTNDENGENPSACSLREALVAASTNRAFWWMYSRRYFEFKKLMLYNLKMGYTNSIVSWCRSLVSVFLVSHL